MKYKILLTGKNNTIIDDFFSQLVNDFELMTTSARYNDIIKHISYFEPDALLCCVRGELREEISQIANARYRLLEAEIPIILFGAKEDCDEFEKIAINVSNLTLYRPLSIPEAREKIQQFVEEYQRKRRKEREPEKKPFVLDFDLDELERQLSGREGVAGAAVPLQGAVPDGKSSPRKHVLVVDDNSMMLKLIKEYLHEEYDVATAVSGKIALKFLEKHRTDLILLDYEMPEENGPAVLEKLRASDETKDIPVVFLTGVTEKKQIQEALALKPQNYLLKPIDRDKLVGTIQEIIGK